MIKLSFVCALVSLMALMYTQQLNAQATAVVDTSVDSWVLLGSKTVNYTIDRDIVELKKSGTNFTSLKLVVKNGTLNMHKCTVHFTNGDTKIVEFPGEVTNANDGRILDLIGNTKAIEKVTFWYDTKNSSDSKSTVELWGK